MITKTIALKADDGPDEQDALEAVSTAIQNEFA